MWEVCLGLEVGFFAIIEVFYKKTVDEKDPWII
jgi:hypothetical protein